MNFIKKISLLSLVLLFSITGCKRPRPSSEGESITSIDGSTPASTSQVVTSEIPISEDLTPFWVHFVTNNDQELESVYTGVIRDMPMLVKEGYTLEGWFLESVFTNIVSFPYYVKSEVTLYAKWTQGNAEEFAFNITEDNSGYIVTSYGGNAQNVVIPSSYNNKPVIEIGEQVFYRNGSVVNVILPASLVKIGFQAFKEAVSLEKIIIPSNVKELATDAFSGASNLSSITLSSNLEIIGNNAFEGVKINEITIPLKVKEINARAFASISTLMRVNLEPRNPPLRFDTSFEDTPNDMKYYVHPEGHDAYLNSPYWSDYSSQIAVIS